MAGDELDMDYVLMAAILAGALAAAGTAATLLARPMLVEAGKQMPLPTVDSIFRG